MVNVVPIQEPRDLSYSNSQKNTGLIIGIIIFTLLSLFVLIIIIMLIVIPNAQTPPQYPIANGYFMSSCAQNNCNDGLICDGTDFICRYGTGSSCESAFDCGPELTCSGVCVAGPYGGLDQYCPCNTGYKCQINNNGPNICKGVSGTVCTRNSDCISNVCKCDDQDTCICMSGNPNSYPCTKNSDCSSNNCDGAFCQPSGIITGTLGASCAGDCLPVPSGESGASCSGNTTCVCVYGTDTPGVCIQTNQGIGDTCSTHKICSNNLICYNSNGSKCESNDLNCQCLFPYTNPNTPVQNICISGMAPRSSLCLNDTNLGCNSGTMCFSNSCIGPPVTAVYNFFKDNSNLNTDFLSATTTSLIAGFTGPNPQIIPYKMFATSNNLIDTIYLIDRSSGFYSITYDTSQNKSGSWTQWFPNNTSYGLLDDVSYSGSTFLVSFSNSLYLWDMSSNLFTLFNNGIQYTIQNSQYIPLTVDYLSISSSNDIIISSQGTIYIKQSSNTYYDIAIIQGGPMNGLPIINTFGPPSFYYDTSGINYHNISFVSNYTDNIDNSISYQQILQFSGSVAGQIAPVDIFGNLQYKVFDYNIYSPTLETDDTSPGMTSASIIMLTTTTTGLNVVALNYSGTTAIVPYNFNETSRCAVTNNAFYIISKASCM